MMQRRRRARKGELDNATGMPIIEWSRKGDLYMEDGGARRLLLVEDEAIIGLSEARMLAREGYEVTHVLSGEDAVAAVAAGSPGIDLVLMDINLGPGMDGTAAAQRILAARDIPLVFLSSHTEPAIVEKTEGITNYGYIVKNSGPTVLFTAIKMAFKLHDARKELERSLAARKEAEDSLRKSELHYREIFMNDAVALLEEDFSGARRRIEALKASGVDDLEAWLAGHLDEAGAMVREVRILDMNRAYRELFGFTEDAVMPGANIASLPTVEVPRLVREFAAFARGADSYTEDMEVRRAGRPPVTLKLLMSIPAEHLATWDRVYVSFIDITKEKLAERSLESLVRDKETLMRELEHRVKNSMALISGIFGLEADRLSDAASKRVFEEAEERVRTVSAIYDLLSRSTEVLSLDSREELSELVRLFEETYLHGRRGIRIETGIEPITLSIKQAADVGLVVNELLTNAAKYACPSGKECRIRLEFSLAEGFLRIVAVDEGPGLPPGFDAEQNGHLGFDLMRLLAGQYRGKLALSEGPGLRAEVTMRYEAPPLQA